MAQSPSLRTRDDDATTRSAGPLALLLMQHIGTFGGTCGPQIPPKVPSSKRATYTGRAPRPSETINCPPFIDAATANGRHRGVGLSRNGSSSFPMNEELRDLVGRANGLLGLLVGLDAKVGMKCELHSQTQHQRRHKLTVCVRETHTLRDLDFSITSPARSVVISHHSLGHLRSNFSSFLYPSVLLLLKTQRRKP